MISEEIDILKLYSGLLKGFEDNKAWNIWLTKCLNTDNLNELIAARRGIQIGMTSAQKKRLTNDSINVTFCRWISSIDRTVRKIVKKRIGPQEHKDKKIMDNDVELFLRKSSY